MGGPAALLLRSRALRMMVKRQLSTFSGERRPYSVAGGPGDLLPHGEIITNGREALGLAG